MRIRKNSRESDDDETSLMHRDEESVLPSLIVTIDIMNNVILNTSLSLVALRA